MARFLLVGALLLLIPPALLAGDGDSLPIYQPSDLIPGMVDASARGEEHHTVGDFAFTDQAGETITQRTIAGKISVVNFFFTTCPSICLDMNRKLKKVQDAFEADGNVVMLSYTVDPDTDTPAKLAAYAKALEIKRPSWHLLTGPKSGIYAMARKQYFAVFEEGTPGTHDFIHTDAVVLVDARRRLRGFFHGTLPRDIEQLIADIGTLRNEARLGAKAPEPAVALRKPAGDD